MTQPVWPAGLRAVVRTSVAERTPVDGRECSSIEQVTAALDQLPAPFDRTAGPVHVTGSGVVVGGRGVVLLRHKRLGIWVQPGGHLEPGEPPWEAAVRETEEETGLDVRLVQGARLLHVDVHPSGEHTHLDLRYLLAADPEKDPHPGADESQDVRWFTWSEAVAVADDGLRGLLVALRPPGD